MPRASPHVGARRRSLLSLAQSGDLGFRSAIKKSTTFHGRASVNRIARMELAVMLLACDTCWVFGKGCHLL